MANDKPTIEDDRVDYRGTKYTLEDAVMLGLIPPTEDSKTVEEVPGEAADDQHPDAEPGDAVATGSRRPRRQS